MIAAEEVTAETGARTALRANVLMDASKGRFAYETGGGGGSRYRFDVDDEYPKENPLLREKGEVKDTVMRSIESDTRLSGEQKIDLKSYEELTGYLKDFEKISSDSGRLDVLKNIKPTPPLQKIADSFRNATNKLINSLRLSPETKQALEKSSSRVREEPETTASEIENVTKIARDTKSIPGIKVEVKSKLFVNKYVLGALGIGAVGAMIYAMSSSRNRRGEGPDITCWKYENGVKTDKVEPFNFNNNNKQYCSCGPDDLYRTNLDSCPAKPADISIGEPGFLTCPYWNYPKCTLYDENGDLNSDGLFYSYSEVSPLDEINNVINAAENLTNESGILQITRWIIFVVAILTSMFLVYRGVSLESIPYFVASGVILIGGMLGFWFI